MVQYKPLQKHAPDRDRWSSNWWWQEIISIIASLGCMIAVVVILSKMQDQPMGHWTFFIGLNAVIALFVTAAKSTAMLSVAACIGQWKWVYMSSKTRKLSDIDTIEEASRGPLGSLQMITTIPWGWATLGAIITVLALGIDTFAQEVISTEVVTESVTDGTASFKVARDYFTDAKRSADGARYTPDPFTVDTSMQGAVVKAFYNLDSPPIFACASNCTWDQAYISLGFSSSCTNVTQATYATQRCNGTLPTNCTMTTPGNVTFSTSIIPTFWSTVLVIEAKSPEYDEWYVPDREPASFVRLAVFRQPSDYKARLDGALEQTLECDISFVAYKYSNATSVGNTFAFGSVEKIQLEDGYMREAEGLNRSSDRYVLFNKTGLPEFRVSTLDLGALREYFTSDSFSGTLVDGEEKPVYSQGITAAIRNPQTNISALLDSMAISMTNQLRTSPNATIAPGRTAKSVLLVRIQWEWLSLPFFVVLASAAFLIAEMFQSRRTQGIMLWKFTATSLLFHSVKPTEGSLRTDVQSPKKLNQMAKTTTVKLEHSKHIS